MSTVTDSTDGTTGRAGDTADRLDAELADIASRHYQVPDPTGIPVLQDGTRNPGICNSDRHRWPCHAHVLGEALGKVLKRHEGKTDPDYPQTKPLCPECGEYSPCLTVQTISRALLGEEAADG